MWIDNYSKKLSMQCPRLDRASFQPSNWTAVALLVPSGPDAHIVREHHEGQDWDNKVPRITLAEAEAKGAVGRVMRDWTSWMRAVPATRPKGTPTDMFAMEHLVFTRERVAQHMSKQMYTALNLVEAAQYECWFDHDSGSMSLFLAVQRVPPKIGAAELKLAREQPEQYPGFQDWAVAAKPPTVLPNSLLEHNIGSNVGLIRVLESIRRSAPAHGPIVLLCDENIFMRVLKVPQACAWDA